MPKNKTNTSGKNNYPWKDKVINHNQLGGIETSILDNGPGKGVRIAWINTGSGLRFKVLPDRGMDIADAFFNEHSLAWISHLGVTSPNPAVNSGTNWLNNFGGGLLTTCGLTHVGGPEKDGFGERGIHDRINNIPAEIESVSQPDLLNEKLEMSIRGRVLQSTVFGPHLLLTRTISARLGESGFRIKDEVTNTGNSPAPHMLLYHFNFGWPIVDEGSEINWKGKLYSRGSENDNFIFDSDHNYKICPSILDQHSDNGEAVGFIDPYPDAEGNCECSVENSRIGIKVSIRFKKDQLPLLTNWQHWGRNEYVNALEPCTHYPIGQSASRANGQLIFIGPGETKIYEIDLIINKLF